MNQASNTSLSQTKVCVCVCLFTLVKLQVNGSNRLQFRLGSSLLTVCADAWNSHLSVFTCRYLGYR